MAFEQDRGSPNMTFEVKANPSHNKKLSSSSDSLLENSNGCFDCNICLDTSHDPVVTLCGHLYCWPCIYKWLRVQNASSELNEQPNCPVCKARISSSSLVPLYGRGTSPCHDSEVEEPKKALKVPQRPQAPGSDNSADVLASATSMSADLNQQQNVPNTFHRREYVSHPFDNYSSTTPQTSTTSFYSPTIHMVSEMVFARIFGGSETNMFAYPYSNSYHGSPRLRRQEMQLDKSLNRVSIFLFCCIVLCLILF